MGSPRRHIEPSRHLSPLLHLLLTLSETLMHPTDLESRIRQQLVMIEQSINAARPTELLAAKAGTNECSLCEQDFPSRAALQQHMHCHVNGDPNAPYRCDECGKTFSVPARLNRHYRTHTGEKPHVCTICHKSFSVKETLSVHLRIHTQERPYPCTVCHRSFEHSGKLHRHMRIHTGERPHQCTLCNKTFIQSGQLVIHMRTHTGEKPYVCASCNKGFTCSKQLKVHMRTHTGEKPYSCDICGKSFGYNHVLKLHQVAHFGEKVYKCTLCKTTFNNKKQLETHIKSHDESNMAEMLCSPPRPSSVGSSHSETSTSSDKENSYLFRPSPFYPVSRSPISLIPPPAHLSSPSPLQQTSDPMDSQFILPSINSICPGEAPSLPTLTLRPTSQLKAPSPNLSRGSPIFPVTPSLVKSLMKADLEEYGPPNPLATPPLRQEIFSKCPPPTSAQPASPSPPSPTISTMRESSLPLRKRRLALSESSESSSSSSSSVKEERHAPSPTNRGSVIMFAARS